MMFKEFQILVVLVMYAADTVHVVVLYDPKLSGTWFNLIPGQAIKLG